MERIDMQTAELISRLRMQALEIADANEPGWGNTMTDAANEIERLLERADYAWRNTNVIEKANQEEMAKRDAAERDVERLREVLQEIATHSVCCDARHMSAKVLTPNAALTRGAEVV